MIPARLMRGCISCYASSSLENFPPSAAAVLPQIYRERERGAQKVSEKSIGYVAFELSILEIYVEIEILIDCGVCRIRCMPYVTH